jgi:hypothetical protein
MLDILAMREQTLPIMTLASIEISRSSIIMPSLLLIFSGIYFQTPINSLAALMALHLDPMTCLGKSFGTIVNKLKATSRSLILFFIFFSLALVWLLSEPMIHLWLDET